MSKFTRREILAAFLGLPFALAACKSTSENSAIAGEIVGANVNVGHILRELRNPEVPVNNWENVKVKPKNVARISRRVNFDIIIRGSRG